MGVTSRAKLKKDSSFFISPVAGEKPALGLDPTGRHGRQRGVNLSALRIWLTSHLSLCDNPRSSPKTGSRPQGERLVPFAKIQGDFPSRHPCRFLMGRSKVVFRLKLIETNLK